MMLTCPYCAEAVGVDIDEGGLTHQNIEQECPVCSREWEVAIVRDAEGAWTAKLHTETE